MVKVVTGPQPQKRRSSAKTSTGGLASKRVVTPDGYRTVTTVDVHSPTLDDDLRAVFQRNVNRARKDNKRIIGSYDGVSPKR